MAAVLPFVAPVGDLDALKREQSNLQLRLEDGYQRIERSLQEGEDVTRWEDFWVQLLAQYEHVCDAIRDLS